MTLSGVMTTRLRATPGSKADRAGDVGLGSGGGMEMTDSSRVRASRNRGSWKASVASGWYDSARSRH